MRLFHVPQTRSNRILWLLEEIGEPYDLTVMTREERESDEHRVRHPLGRVPAIDDGEGYLFESSAIALHLADLYPQAVLNWPVGSHERGLVYQWVAFAVAELEPGMVQVLRNRGKDPNAAGAGAERFAAPARVLEHALTDREFLVGSRFSVADVVCGAMLATADRLDLLADFPAARAYVGRLEARPARQRAQSIGTA